ncbi:Cytidine monophosphate-N-acetylneuraminic acid hydroxylase [Bagarius yarrelli]|uniref:Cytidine monophosphate-N-acetylneuraminic acid hydroxylase n=1 Tax=Bagarius yarrelli TaxID=175774 RepID=A0A556VAT9_BAGYA|nr:Cytidine monophosphate-N-acetylneuraminic acid hydroxylase [Bagarius yarrelli]
MSQVAQTVLKLDTEAVQGLKHGINFKKNKEGKCFIIYKDGDLIRACRNQCKHQGGLFNQDMEDMDGRTVRCSKHFWKLNVATMKYVNPPDSFTQDELEVVQCGDGGLEFVELDPPDPWTVDPRTAEELQPGEVTLTYITHACVEVKTGPKRMMFDPWLVGPAFARGWWLLHEPPSDALERLYTSDLIYISHMHSDHLSYSTLKLLAERRADLPIFVGNTERPVFWYLKRSGVNLTNINVVPFGIWQNVDEHLRFMILMDGIHPEMDTCIIVEYKGHMILNTVDCTRPNNGRLPHGIDVMLSDFAGGASGFPMTFTGGKYTAIPPDRSFPRVTACSEFAVFVSVLLCLSVQLSEKAGRQVSSKLRGEKLLNYKAQLVKTLRPKVYSPIAGYFIEAHPSDRYIKDTNKKNDPEELNQLINQTCPEIFTWTPVPGAVLDLALTLSKRGGVTQPPRGTQVFKDSWDFEVYLDKLNLAVSSQIFRHKQWVEFYYRWAAFQNYNLVIRVIETDDEFQPLSDGYDYLVDFLDLSFPPSRPDREHAYIELKNRLNVMRYVVLNGLLWDNLYIGFNNRISRNPDIYHHKFWEHFQSDLPISPPDWDSFLKAVPVEDSTQNPCTLS